MELQQDWRAFEQFFGRVFTPPAKALAIDVCSEQEILASTRASWVEQEVLGLSHEVLDRWMSDMLETSGYWEQAQELRARIQKQAGKEALFFTHPVLQWIERDWVRLFPTNFGVYLRWESSAHPSGGSVWDLLLTFRKGRLETYHRPLRGKMAEDRKPEELLQVLSSQYHLPIQGIWLAPELRANLLKTEESGFKGLWSAYKNKYLSLIPRHRGLVLWLWARARFVRSQKA